MTHRGSYNIINILAIFSHRISFEKKNKNKRRQLGFFK